MSVNDLEYEDVDFARTALKAVVCQARYEPLLRISHEPPIDFQEAIRSVFPGLEARKEETALEFRISEGKIEPQVPAESAPTEPTVWNFTTDDKTWTVGLSGKSLSLETSAYSTFEEFSKRYDLVFQAFLAAYPNIDHFTRLGLRFVNVFEQEEFGQGGWQERFNPVLMGVEADDLIGPSITASLGQFIIKEDDWTITVRHGNDAEGNEYKLDLDHAVTGKVAISDVPELIVTFNRHLYDIFRWAISEVMYHDMGPQSRI